MQINTTINIIYLLEICNVHRKNFNGQVIFDHPNIKVPLQIHRDSTLRNKTRKNFSKW